MNMKVLKENINKIIQAMEWRKDEYEEGNPIGVLNYDSIIKNLFDESVDLGYDLRYVCELVKARLIAEKKSHLRFYTLC